MAAGFADIVSLLGVWLGGRARAAVVAARPFPSVGGHVQDWPHHRFTEASWSVPSIFQEPDIVRIVGEAIEEALKNEAATKHSVGEKTTATQDEEAWESISDADIMAAIDQLFATPSLAALAEERRRQAISASAEAIRRADRWREEDRLYRIAQARLRDDEEALLLLL